MRVRRDFEPALWWCHLVVQGGVLKSSGAYVAASKGLNSRYTNALFVEVEIWRPQLDVAFGSKRPDGGNSARIFPELTAAGQCYNTYARRGGIGKFTRHIGRSMLSS